MNAVSSRKVITCLQIFPARPDFSLDKASNLLRQTLKRTFFIDTADGLCAELERLGFAPQPEHDVRDGGTMVAVWIDDPNLGALRIHFEQTDVTVH